MARRSHAAPISASSEPASSSIRHKQSEKSSDADAESLHAAFTSRPADARSGNPGPSDILALQRSIGNRQVTRLLQSQKTGFLSSKTPRLQRLMSYTTFEGISKGNANRNKILAIDGDVQNYDSNAAYPVRLNALNALIQKCDVYLGFSSFDATRQSGVKKLKAEAITERDAISHVIQAELASDAVQKWRHAMRARDLKIKADDAGSLILNLTNNIDAMAQQGVQAMTPEQRQRVAVEDRSALEALMSNSKTPGITKRVIAEVLGLIDSNDVKFEEHTGGAKLSGLGANEKYTVKYSASNTTIGNPTRLAQMAHEVTHVSVHESFQNTDVFLAFLDNTPDPAIIALEQTRIALINQMLNLLTNDTVIPDQLKSNLTIQLGYAIGPKFGQYLANLQPKLTLAQYNRLSGLFHQGVTSAALIEFDSVINESLVAMELYKVPQSNAVYKKLRSAAETAYQQRATARATQNPQNLVGANAGNNAPNAGAPAQLMGMDIAVDATALPNGHEMDIGLDIDAGAAPSGTYSPYTVFGAGVEYWEEVKVDYDFMEPTANQVGQRIAAKQGKETKPWNDVYALHSNSPTFKKQSGQGGTTLTDAVTDAKQANFTGRHWVRFVDVPQFNAQTNRYGKRTTKFRVVGYDATGNRRIITAVQSIILDGTAAPSYKHYSDSEGNSVTTGAGGTAVSHVSTEADMTAGVPKDATKKVAAFAQLLHTGQGIPFDNRELVQLSQNIPTWSTLSEAEKMAAYAGSIRGGSQIAGHHGVPYPQSGLQYYQYPVKGEAALVAVSQNGTVIKMYYTDGRTDNVAVQYKDPASTAIKQGGNVNVRTYTEIPIGKVPQL